MNVRLLPIRSHWKCSTYFANEVYLHRQMKYILNRLCSISSFKRGYILAKCGHPLNI